MGKSIVFKDKTTGEEIYPQLFDKHIYYDGCIKFNSSIFCSGDKSTTIESYEIKTGNIYSMNSSLLIDSPIVFNKNIQTNANNTIYVDFSETNVSLGNTTIGSIANVESKIKDLESRIQALESK
jgi:hypothetical protein